MSDDQTTPVRAMNSYPEGQDWQTTCRACGRQTCPKPEKVAEWLRGVQARLHETHLQKMAGETWRFLTSAYDAALEAHLATWALALEGTCPECLPVDARLDSPERLHSEAMARWAKSRPEAA